MNRKLLLLVFGLMGLAALAVIVLSGGGGRVSTAPRFVPGPPSSISPYAWNHYDWGANVPFRNDKMWLWIAGPKTNYHAYLFDLKNQVILGELFNASIPVLSSKDGSRILCEGEVSPAVTLKMKLRKMLDSILAKFGKGALPASNTTETFWLLDLPTSTATVAGNLSQVAGAGSGWCPSPNSRYGFTVPTTSYNSAMYLCDFDKKALSRIPISATPKGWWDDQHVLFSNGPNHFFLLDVTTQRTSTLFTPEYVNALLTLAGPTNDPAGLDTLSSWNGGEYDFYFGIKGIIRGLGNPESFLFKADKSGHALKLLYRSFTFRWGGHLDKTGRQYLYQGELAKSGSGGDGSVYIQDLLSGTTTTVVPPDNGGQYSIPRFYNDEVIYFRKRILRRVGLNASNDVPLFPFPSGTNY